ncbi:F1 atpase assembly protein 11 [Mycena venus]|uniref:F1 atpase assembly protein 11 n=1 Tax=Mycena venus TaxID=2733690 RepID=A0A8H7CL73_9AGAR|nr:F1 atpase assembly protein 11 [Mycena venus]
MFRSAITRSTIPRSSVAYARSFHATPVPQKTVTEKVSEVADTVNKKLGKGLASAIETGQEAAASTKDTVSSTAEQGKKKAGEAATVVGQKKNEAAASARETKDDLARKAESK